MTPLPASWHRVLARELEEPYFASLAAFIDGERSSQPVFPPAEDVFSALRLTPLDQVKVVIVGQDPYHCDGQAHGLCFSVRPGVKPPPTLQNIFKELRNDLGLPVPPHGCLEAWARQGVLMLNTVLTVRAHEPHSHKNKGWEQFTDAVLGRVNDRTDPVVFVLWGTPARKKADLIDKNRHATLSSAHPSPLSARHGFFGSRPFSKINSLLRARGQGEIDWTIAPSDQ